MRKLRRKFILAIGAFVAAMCMCQLYEPLTPPHLGPPQIQSIGLCEARVYGTYRETVRLAWAAPPTDSIGIRSYTLIRHIEGDSSFDVFTRSQGIPPDIDTFKDDVTPIGFPVSEFILLQYRIYAIDSLGRTSDTSEPCSLYLANQPALDTFDQAKSCFRWHTGHIMGSLDTYIKIWGPADSIAWKSEQFEDFGDENVLKYFTACLPDSLRPLVNGRWHYAIYLFAMGTKRQSLKVDSFYVQ